MREDRLMEEAHSAELSDFDAESASLRTYRHLFDQRMTPGHGVFDEERVVLDTALRLVDQGTKADHGVVGEEGADCRMYLVIVVRCSIVDLVCLLDSRAGHSPSDVQSPQDQSHQGYHDVVRLGKRGSVLPYSPCLRGPGYEHRSPGLLALLYEMEVSVGYFEESGIRLQSHGHLLGRESVVGYAGRP
jgi:hypothetical protein